jgi:hypothetical protein
LDLSLAAQVGLTSNSVWTDEILADGAKAFWSNAGPNEPALANGFNQQTVVLFGVG